MAQFCLGDNPLSPGHRRFITLLRYKIIFNSNSLRVRKTSYVHFRTLTQSQQKKIQVKIVVDRVQNVYGSDNIRSRSCKIIHLVVYSLTLTMGKERKHTNRDKYYRLTYNVMILISPFDDNLPRSVQPLDTVLLTVLQLFILYIIYITFNCSNTVMNDRVWYK